ncbi:MAG: DM13 domain-containing protein [Pseudomonadales bacterium]
MKLLTSALFATLLLITTTVTAQTTDTLAQGKLDGAFSSWGKSSLDGSWSIVKDGEEHYIVLGDNFRAKKGPDVKVFLSPTPSKDVTGDNAVNGSVFVTLLSSFEGSARIKIPAGTELSTFQSLVFHCQEYSKLWGSSALR